MEPALVDRFATWKKQLRDGVRKSSNQEAPRSATKGQEYVHMERSDIYGIISLLAGRM